VPLSAKIHHSFIHIRLLKTEMTERICTSNSNTRRI